MRILEESKPLGNDHNVVLETLTALGTVGSEEAVPALAATIFRRSFFARRKLRAIKERGVAALVRIGSASATATLDRASKTGDRMLKKIAAGRSS